MSTTLIIRHLSADLTTDEREDFLKQFGAEKVWFLNANSHSAFASFKTISEAETALSRLHQLELFGKRLTVEYARESNNINSQPNLQANSDKNFRIKQFIDGLNSWNLSIDFFQPPPPNLRYKYPSPKPNILFNIIYALQNNLFFYTQTLHLMNKIGLDPPFDDLNENVKSFLTNCLMEAGIELQNNEPPVNTVSMEDPQLSSEESEISSSDDIPVTNDIPKDFLKKRKSSLRRINKIPRSSLQLKGVHSEKKNNKIYDTKDVFEKADKQESKKIELRVSKSLILENPSNDIVEIIGTIGKVNPLKPDNELENKTMETTDDNDDTSTVNSDVITIQELLENKVSLKDMKVLPIYKNYHPGTPSMRLYIKNLSKDVDARDVERIYKRYIVDCDRSKAAMFNVRVMQEGRMKGQAFVTLPTTELSEKALSETNGFILKNKPMVVQFARTAK